MSRHPDHIPCFLGTEALAHAFRPTELRAIVRSRPEDFCVVEDLGFIPEGHGTHVWLNVSKRNLNTSSVARELATLAGVRQVDVGYAGLKDRCALATQWFSVNMERTNEPDWSQLETENLHVIAVKRHPRKLRRGHLRGNRFTLVLHETNGDLAALAERLSQIKECGVPNYFAEQRFGRKGGNARKAYEMLIEGRRIGDRHLRGIYLSAARALLFNRVVSERVENQVWNAALPGDIMMLDGTHSLFPVVVPDDEIHRRVACQDIHPTGPLWGRGETLVRTDARTVEESALSGCQPWFKGLVAAGLKQERRAVRVRVKDLTWSHEGTYTIHLSFALPAGSYATAVLRELVAAR